MKPIPVLLTLSGLLLAVPVWAEQGYGGYDAGAYGAETLDERVAKLERKLSGQVLMELNGQIERLQRELAKTRGQLEEVNHKLETLKSQQQAMYTDLDQRIRQGAGGAAPAPASSESAGANAPDAGAEDAGSGSETRTAAAAATPVPAPTSRPVAPPPVSDGAAREAAYQKAFGTLKDGKYAEAIKEFKSFTARYPSGDYADNGQYWLGEAYYVNRDFTSAKDAFQKLIKNFPQSAKVSDAALKLAYIESDTGQAASAKQMLNDVIKRYPGSTAAKQAEKRLQKLQQEKR
ncbi:tol-pal system protein YbgF [Methylococcus geothermalis]|uniref:Cell division coordinator CpoB n=1 Tax=Methylococcus geothermalis TaxID=2681310 RepID=A0A858Q7D0_9GAMM|nr:tol-pal system protein YbgF [Methylococcus geothermalis]QJD29616.1 tol-pal system protein YbgF [Methylococcus geothermalis]